MRDKSNEITRTELISFDSTHKAIRTEKLLKADIGGTLIPTPREISASCGLSFRIEEGSLMRVYKLLVEQPTGLEGLSLYEIQKQGNIKTARSISWEELRDEEVL